MYYKIQYAINTHNSNRELQKAVIDGSQKIIFKRYVVLIRKDIIRHKCNLFKQFVLKYEWCSLFYNLLSVLLDGGKYFFKEGYCYINNKCIPEGATNDENTCDLCNTKTAEHKWTFNPGTLYFLTTYLEWSLLICTQYVWN